MEATNLIGTNSFVETSVAASETAQAIEQTQTAAAEVAFQATQQSIQASDEPVPQGTEQVTDEPTEATVNPVVLTASAVAIGSDVTPTPESDTGDAPSPTNTETSQTGGGDFPNRLTYTVQQGDTVMAIALRFDSSVEAILAANGLNDSGLVFIGQTLIIPVRTGTGEPAPTAEIPSVPSPTMPSGIPTQTPTSTTTPTASPPPTATQIPTEIAAIPVRVVVVGEEIGIGTIRLFAPEEARYPETVRVELDLRLSQQVWTATPPSDDNIPPDPPSSSDSSTGTESESEPAPAGTPSTTPNFEQSGLAVFQKMGASLFCLESSFTGCDQESNPAEAEIITDLERGIRWSWVIRPDEVISGQQDLQVDLWRVVVADDGPEEADVVWSHFFQISANPQRSQPESDNDVLPVAVIIAVMAAGLALLAFFGRRALRSAGQNKARQVGPKVFISYRRHDTWAVARTLYDQLESRRARVFLDVKDINEGRFADIIEKNIELCEYFVPILGPGTLESTWVRREIASAIAHNKVIIPILVSGFTFDAPLPEDIKELESHNSITLLPEYLDAAIARLLQFLHLTDT